MWVFDSFACFTERSFDLQVFDPTELLTQSRNQHYWISEMGSKSKRVAKRVSFGCGRPSRKTGASIPDQEL